MKNETKLLTLVTLVSALAFPIWSQADIIASNLGPGSSYDCCGNWAVSGAATTLGERDAAMPIFTPVGQDFNLTQIDIALVYFFLGTNSFRVQLMNDNGGLPGTTIHSWTLSSLPFAGEFTIQPSQTISGITGITLTGGTQYWLAAFPGAADSVEGWDIYVNGTSQLFAVSSDGGTTWNYHSKKAELNGAYDLQGTPIGAVPEPRTTLLLAAVLLCAGFRRKNRRNGPRSAPGAVAPQPFTELRYPQWR